tara:strand:- start:931 stop:1407 length:477 start_codon:yes stop_codon:yes gene_type:complete
MRSDPRTLRKKKGGKTHTLRKRIHKYVCEKKDICCEEDVDRDIIIEQIIEKYKKISKLENESSDEYISWINNDISKFIGYRVNLKNKDDHGLKLWDEIDKIIYKGQESNVWEKMDKNMMKDNIVKVLKEVPLYYLLSFLGIASYKEELAKPSRSFFWN